MDRAVVFRTRTVDLALGAVMAALALVIPLAFCGTPLQLNLPFLGFSATLASHVPEMISVLVGPSMAFAVGVASSVGFLRYVESRGWFESIHSRSLGIFSCNRVSIGMELPESYDHYRVAHPRIWGGVSGHGFRVPHASRIRHHRGHRHPPRYRLGHLDRGHSCCTTHSGSDNIDRRPLDLILPTEDKTAMLYERGSSERLFRIFDESKYS